MIDLITVKAGDKLHTRQGDVLVVYQTGGDLRVGGGFLSDWLRSGEWVSNSNHPLDIIRIEKHEPVIEVFYASQDCVFESVHFGRQCVGHAEPLYKITITDGVPSIEKVE